MPDFSATSVSGSVQSGQTQAGSSTPAFSDYLAAANQTPTAVPQFTTDGQSSSGIASQAAGSPKIPSASDTGGIVSTGTQFMTNNATAATPNQGVQPSPNQGIQPPATISTAVAPQNTSVMPPNAQPGIAGAVNQATQNQTAQGSAFQGGLPVAATANQGGKSLPYINPEAYESLPVVNDVNATSYNPNTINTANYIQGTAAPIIANTNNTNNQTLSALGQSNDQFSGLAATVAAGAPKVAAANVGSAAQMSAAQVANTPLAVQTNVGTSTGANNSNVDQSQSDQARAIQMNELQGLESVANGQPSQDAQRVLAQTNSQNLAAQVALANSSGGNPALNARQAANNLATTTQQNQGTALNLYSEEKQAAQQLEATQANQVRSSDITTASQNAAQATQVSLQNAAAANNFKLTQASMTQATELANVQQQYLVAQQQANLDQQAGLTNTQAQNAAQLLQAQLTQQASTLTAQLQSDANAQGANIATQGLQNIVTGIINTQANNFNTGLTLVGQAGTQATGNQTAINAASAYNASNAQQAQEVNQQTAAQILNSMNTNQTNEAIQYTANQGKSNGAVNSLINAGAQVAAAAIPKVVEAASDKNLKEYIQDSPAVAHAILDYLQGLDKPNSEQKDLMQFTETIVDPIADNKPDTPSGPLAFLRSLTPSTWQYKDASPSGVSFPEAGTPGVGVMAQDVEKIHPELVKQMPYGKGIDVGRATNLLLAGSSALAKKTSEHDNAIADLYAKLGKKK